MMIHGYTQHIIYNIRSTSTQKKKLKITNKKKKTQKNGDKKQFIQYAVYIEPGKQRNVYHT